MAGFVDSTVKDIDDRLKELQDEVVKLEAARAALVGTPGAGRVARLAQRRRRHDDDDHATPARPSRRRGPAGHAAGAVATRARTRRWSWFAHSPGSRSRRSPMR